jgi:hypothetical protein
MNVRASLHHVFKFSQLQTSYLTDEKIFNQLEMSISTVEFLILEFHCTFPHFSGWSLSLLTRWSVVLYRWVWASWWTQLYFRGTSTQVNLSSIFLFYDCLYISLFLTFPITLSDFLFSRKQPHGDRALRRKNQIKISC